VPVGADRVADFDQFAAKLDYIRGLGFNAIALLPMSKSRRCQRRLRPGRLFRPESAYGPPESLAAW